MKSMEIEFQGFSGIRSCLKSVRFVVHRFGMGTDSTQSAVVLDINRKSWPVVVLPDLVECLCLTKISCKGVIMWRT